MIRPGFRFCWTNVLEIQLKRTYLSCEIVVHWKDFAGVSRFEAVSPVVLKSFSTSLGYKAGLVAKEVLSVLGLFSVPPRDRMVIFGDSHSRTRLMRGVFVRHIGPITLFRAGRLDEGRRLYAESLSPKTPGLKPLLRVALRSPDTLVVLSFGEIDCRCHVGRRLASDGSAEVALENLADAAMTLLAEVASASNRRVLFLSITPPSNVDLNPEFPVVGDIRKRTQWTDQLNAKIQSRILDAGSSVFGFVDYTGPVKDRDGSLLKEISDGNVHLAPQWSRYKVDTVRMVARGLEGKKSNSERSC